MRHGLPGWAIAAFAIACGACGGGGGGSPPAATLVAITLAPPSPTTIIGGTVGFHATGAYGDGSTRDVTDQATWASSALATASVSNATGTRGIATGLAAGSTTIAATIGAVHGETALAVVAATVTAIRIDPASPVVAVGGTTTLRCLGATSAGLEVDVTGLATWSSDATDVASVSAGVVAGAKAGTARVTASYGGFTANAIVTVSVQPPALTGLELSLPASASLPVGAASRAEVVAVYADGSRSTVTPLAAFASTAPGVLAFGHMPGEYQALATGTATVTAAWSGKTASSTVQVVQNGLSALVIDPSPPLLPAGDALPLHATVLHLDGTASDVTADAIWTTDAPQVVTVDGAGVATAAGAGSAVVRAAYGSLSAATIIDVTGSTATQLALSVSAVSLQVGGTANFSGTLWFADGTSEPAADAARFVIADPTIVAMARWGDGTLYYRGLAAGSTTVAVSAGGLTQTVAVQVSSPASLLLDVPAVTVAGIERPVGVTAVSASGAARALVSSQAEWSSDAPSTADVTRDVRGYPRLVARGAGTAHVTASFAGVTATATVVVVDPPTWIEVTPSSFGVQTWSSQALTVTGHLATGATANLTGVADWIVDPPGVGTIYSGVFQGSGAGTATVTAAVAGLAGHAEAAVWSDQPTSLVVAPPLASGASGPYTLPPGTVARFSVSAQYAYYVPTRPPLVVAWTSADPAVATFSSDPARRGELTALAPGTATITATYELPTGGTRSATATVRVAPLVSISPSPTPLGLMPAESRAVTVTGTFDDGAGGTFTADVTPWAAWTSSAPAVARPASVLNASYLLVPGVLGVSPGGAVLTASLGGATVDVPVIGLPPSVSSLKIAYRSPGSVGLTFSPTVSAVLVPNGRAVDVTSLATWSADGTVLGVSGTPPVVSLLAAGTGSLQASFGGTTASSAVSVVSYPYYGLVPDVRRITLEPGGTDSFQVREYRQNYQGDTVSGDATVTSSNPAVASAWPSTNGVYVQAHAPGEAIVTASFGGVDARVAVNVFDMHGDLWLWQTEARVLHVHERAELSVTDSVSALRLFFSTGSALTWTTSDPSVLAVLGPGSVQALKPGLAVVTVSTAAWKASIPVTVSSAALVEVVPSTPAVPLPVGAVQPLRAYARYADGASVDATDDVTWWSAAPTAAAFDGAPGAVRALAAGTTRVECRLDGLAGYAEVTGF